MEQDNAYMLLKQMRDKLNNMIDRIEEILLHAEHMSPSGEIHKKLRLSTMPAYFKGMKPVAVFYPDGREVMASTWKQAAAGILRECASDEEMRSRLQEISGKVFGRNRIILGPDAGRMDVPVEIAEGVFFESKFDTESLLKVLTTRVLDPIGYDYSQIYIEVRNPKLMKEEIPAQECTAEPTEEPGDSEDEAAVQTM